MSAEGAERVGDAWGCIHMWGHGGGVPMRAAHCARRAAHKSGPAWCCGACAETGSVKGQEGSPAGAACSSGGCVAKGMGKQIRGRRGERASYTEAGLRAGNVPGSLPCLLTQAAGMAPPRQAYMSHGSGRLKHGAHMSRCCGWHRRRGAKVGFLPTRWAAAALLGCCGIQSMGALLAERPRWEPQQSS